MKYRTSIFSKIIITFIALTMLFGCATQNPQIEEPKIVEETTPETNKGESTSTNEPDPGQTEISVPETENNISANENNSDEKEEIVENLNDPQLNSVTLLNYLTVLAEKIHQSPNSRLFLEDVYNVLINELYPNAIDQKTQSRVSDMFHIINELRMIDVKRERLTYIYNQNKANALLNAVPSPMSILNVVVSENPLKMAVSAISLAIDSVSSYKSAMASNEISYLEGNWKLDDSQDERINQTRIDAWNYMINIVRDYNLEGDLALNENAVNELVKWENNTNITRRIEFLKSNESKYKAYGYFWLLLASSYYEANNYEECIASIDTYLSLQSRIFRKDSELAKVLPLGIAALGETGNDTEKEIEYASRLVNNIGSDDWDLKYFAALTYMDIYSKTKDQQHLSKAYSLAKDNVNNLIDRQLQLNRDYVSDIEEAPTPKNATEEEKKEIKEYNKMLKETRKKELPPVDATLLLNTNLLLSLAKELNVSSSELSTIDNILHEHNNNLVLDDNIDKNLWANLKNKKNYDKVVEFDGKTITLSANLITVESIVQLKLEKEKTVIGNWAVNKVNRKGEDVSSYLVSLTSKDLKYKFSDGEVIVISILPYGDMFEEETYKFKVKESKIVFVPKYDFEKID